MKDHEHPFFRPLWRRIAIVALCVAWSIFEFSTGASFWGILAAGFAAYAVWQFFYLYKESPASGTSASANPVSGAPTSEAPAPENRE